MVFFTGHLLATSMVCACACVRVRVRVRACVVDACAHERVRSPFCPFSVPFSDRDPVATRHYAILPPIDPALDAGTGVERWRFEAKHRETDTGGLSTPAKSQRQDGP